MERLEVTSEKAEPYDQLSKYTYLVREYGLVVQQILGPVHQCVHVFGCG